MKSYKQRCFEDWKWMQEHCLGLTLDIAKVELRLERDPDADNYPYCWACEAVKEAVSKLPPGSWKNPCNYCPIDWGAHSCMATGSPYRPLHWHLEDSDVEPAVLTIENTQAIIDLIEKTWKEG